MEYELIKNDKYVKKYEKIRKSLPVEGKLEFSLRSLKGHEFNMPYVCH